MRVQHRAEASCGEHRDHAASQNDKDCRLPQGVRARVWVQGRHFFSRADALGTHWLWLLRDAGGVLALRIPAADPSREPTDDDIAGLLAHFDEQADEAPWRDRKLGTVWPLPGAPVVPVPRWNVSWGHPLQRAIREFAAKLDDEVLATLGRLEVPGPFFGSVANYNRLACLPQPVRRHRLQALERFPPLVAPLLLDVCGKPHMFGTDEDKPAHKAGGVSLAPPRPLLDAIDRGRDLIGALARHYQVDRALVRSPLFAEPWRGAFATRDLLQLLHAIPAHARPQRREECELRVESLAELPAQWHTPADVARLARAFVGGWDAVWQDLETSFEPLDLRLRDCRDFLRSALQQMKPTEPLAWLDEGVLGLAWIARRGLDSLLSASARWHEQPLVETAFHDGLPDQVPVLFGTWENEKGRATELTTRQALIEEGAAMHHCVGDYWEECVCTPTRFVHLELVDGSTATVQYDCDLIEPNPCFERSDMRGPCNQQCANAMDWLEQDVGYMLNSNRCRTQRAEALAESRRVKAAYRPAVASQVRLLDHRSRQQLRQVLAYCRRQADWRERDWIIHQGQIAGFAYAEGPSLLPQLATGDALQLVREPHNPHDPQAVRVDWRGHKLGYLPRRDNPPIARLLDHGIALHARINYIQTKSDWNQVHCAVVKPATGAAV